MSLSDIHNTDLFDESRQDIFKNVPQSEFVWLFSHNYISKVSIFVGMAHRCSSSTRQHMSGFTFIDEGFITWLIWYLPDFLYCEQTLVSF